MCARVHLCTCASIVHIQYRCVFRLVVWLFVCCFGEVHVCACTSMYLCIDCAYPIQMCISFGCLFACLFVVLDKCMCVRVYIYVFVHRLCISAFVRTCVLWCTWVSVFVSWVWFGVWVWRKVSRQMSNAKCVDGTEQRQTQWVQEINSGAHLRHR